MATLAQSRRALREHEEDLAGRKNVVGLGVVLLEGKRAKGSSYAVAVYVAQKQPLSELAPEDVIPKHLRLRSRGKVVRVPTRVFEEGQFKLE